MVDCIDALLTHHAIFVPHDGHGKKQRFLQGFIATFLFVWQVTTAFSKANNIESSTVLPQHFRREGLLPSNTTPTNTTSTEIMTTAHSHSPSNDDQSIPASETRVNVDKVCIIGSGNWGSAIATIVGRNCERLPQYFEKRVNMWVYEELIPQDDDGSTTLKLSDIINKRHENVKYLPGIRLPENIVAVPDLDQACQGATLLLFVLPHQFLPKLLPVIRRSAHPACRGVSLIKGLGKQVGV